jgi:hypothetical protein
MDSLETVTGDKPISPRPDEIFSGIGYSTKGPRTLKIVVRDDEMYVDLELTRTFKEVPPLLDALHHIWSTLDMCGWSRRVAADCGGKDE